MVRPERVNQELENRRPGQVRVRLLAPSCHTTLQAVLHLWENRDRYGDEERSVVDTILRDEIKATYLGELLQQVREALAGQQEAAPGDSEADLSQPADAGLV